jgi:hypothetical protein
VLTTEKDKTVKRLLIVFLVTCGIETAAVAQPKQLLWGDTHLHSNYSFDAFVNNNMSATPDVAYRFAQGVPVEHPWDKHRVQLKTPLDFLVLSDHAELLGVTQSVYFNGVDNTGLSLYQRLQAWYASAVLQDAIDKKTARLLFIDALPEPTDDTRAAAAARRLSFGGIPSQQQVEVDAWRVITEAADTHNKPGQFTALIGWEYSSIPGGANLHRVVVTDLDAKRAQTFDPFGLDQSAFPQDLWTWLGETAEATNGNFLAIPHNSNISKGAMFAMAPLKGDEMSASYAETRRYWEPIVEITQIKGDSETHPALSPEDPFADFETYPYYIQRTPEEYKPRDGDYIRPALRRGLSLASTLGVNPYQFGVIGSTDAHTGLSSTEEDNFQGKMATDSIPRNKKMRWGDAANQTFGWAMSASGLAAVWAEENTRESIVAAMRRREVYATSGPRIAVRLYGGWDLQESQLDAADFPTNMEGRAVPMGGELMHHERGSKAAPQFLIEAQADPNSGHLDRIQIVKGSQQPDGTTTEAIYDVAWAGEGRLLPDGSLAPVENTVDLATGRVDNRVGAAQLRARWTDPDFNPDAHAFYYARVLQIPTARHSLLDKLALGGEVDTHRPDTIQERAYTSSIWYSP